MLLVPTEAESNAKACKFAPLSNADKDLLNRVLSDRLIASSIALAAQNTFRSGHEWSFFVYPSDGGYSAGPFWVGSSLRPSPSQYITGFLRSSIKPVINVHAHPGTHRLARYPSWEDIRFGLFTNTLSILVTRKGMSAGRQCGQIVK